MAVESYPLHWPAQFPRTNSADREPARFSNGGRPLTVAVARDRVLEEIGKFTRVGRSCRINPDLAIISSNVPTRKDGLPRSGAREPDDPGVAVYFELDGKPKVLPCDKWDRAADNLAAIAAHLSAMRGMERWGVGDLETYFAGFGALEYQPERQWWDVLGCSPDGDPDAVARAYKVSRKQAHPDHGGTAEEFMAVQAAYEKFKGGE